MNIPLFLPFHDYGTRTALSIGTGLTGTQLARREGASIRARAPLRLGLAGGGTDLSPYCDEYGGAILNATIGRYAYAHLGFRDDHRICFSAHDVEQDDVAPLAAELPLDSGLRLHETSLAAGEHPRSGRRPQSLMEGEMSHFGVGLKFHGPARL